MGLKIREIRKQRGLTQSDLARRINKSVSAISSYESGRQVPPLDVALTISRALRVSLEDLIGSEKSTLISIQNLTEQQQKIVLAIIDEFTYPSDNNIGLSSKQVSIINDLLRQFF